MADSSKRETQSQADQYDRDLHPNRGAGQNAQAAADAEVGLQTAYDVKHVHRALSDLTDDELKTIPVLPMGARLQQGGTYLDLMNPGRGEITAEGDMTAITGTAYVPKAEVPYPTYNKLRGITDPVRTT